MPQERTFKAHAAQSGGSVRLSKVNAAFASIRIGRLFTHRAFHSLKARE